MTTDKNLQKPTHIIRRFYDYLNAKPGNEWNDIFAPAWNALPAMPETPNQVAGYCSMVDELRMGYQT